MASKVNVKFVVLLSAFLVLTGVGVGGAYYVVKMRSGEHYVALGDKAMKEGKVEVADKWYERAVGKEQFNVEWLKKWRVAREQVVPELQTAYVASYHMYQGILRNLAQAQKTNIEAHRDYLGQIYQECAYSSSKAGWEYLANRVDEDLRYFEPETPVELRRFRGIALDQLFAGDASLPRDRVELARQDLEAVLKVNPKDGEIATELAVWHRLTADRAKATGDESTRQVHMDKSRQTLTDLLAADPGNAHGLIMVLTLDASDVDLMVDPSKSTAELIRVKSAALDALAPRVKEIGDVLMKADPAHLPSMLINRFAGIAPRIDTKNGVDIALTLIEKLLAADPDDMDYLLTRAQLLPMKGMASADVLISAYQKIIDLKDKPVSFAGVRLLAIRNRARFAQANASLLTIGEAKDAAGRTAAMERAKRFRTELARYIPEQSPELQFIDAKLALYDNDVPRARRLLAEFLKRPGDIGEPIVIEGAMLMADVGLRVNPPELGLARENLRRVVASRPSAIEPRLMLSNVERALQNYDAAIIQLRAILDLDPDNETAKTDLENVNAIVSGATLSDPVLAAIAEAERTSRGTLEKLGDDEAAMQHLAKAFDANNKDPRIALILGTARFQRGDKEGAKTVADQSLQVHTDGTKPDVARLKEFARRLKAVDSLEGLVALINESPASEVDKKLALYRAYTDHQKPEEAKRALDEAEKAAPKDARVIDLRFQDALRANDLATATRLADQAAELNLDQCDGDTFKARLQINQKNFRDAAATLARAVERGNASAAVYRLLGLVQAELGRTQDAIAAFRRAIDLVPTDLPTIKTFMAVLVKANEVTEAIGVARKSELVGRGDPEFLNLWLALEARSGRTDFARSRREQMRERDPKDWENAAALAELYMDEKKWEAARQLIDLVRKEKDSLRGAALDARWHADQGNLNEAKQVFRTYIGALADTPADPQAGKVAKQDAYIAFGQFLYRCGVQAEALAAFRQAESNQDPATMQVTLLMGDVQLTEGLFEDAEASYRRVLDAKVPDPDFRIRKRLIEVLNQMQKFAEAEAVFKEIGPAADEDVEMLAQRASVARGLGDIKRAREILDQAVTKFPDEPMPYLRRARLLSADPAFTKDALADLATAIKLRPGFWQALRTRALIHLGQGRIEDGLRDLQEGVDRNPVLDDLRLELVDYLIRFGKENEAVDAADAALRLRPNDLRLMQQFAYAFVRAGRWSRASRYYKLLWEQLRDELSAFQYCDAMLNSTPPPLAEIESVLAAPEAKTDRSWKLLVLRAHLRKRQGKDAASRTDLLVAFEQVGTEPKALMSYAAEIRRVMPETAQRLTLLNDVRAPAPLQDWLIMIRASIAAEDPKFITESVSSLRALRDRCQDSVLRFEIQKLVSELLIRQENWEESLQEIRLALQFKPSDAMMSNNAAAILSEHLKRPHEALPYAERACSLVPNHWAYLDTLAAVHWSLGDKAQALRRLSDSLRLAQREADKATTAIKLANWKLESGDRAGAVPLYDMVRDMITDSPTLGDTVKTPMEELKAKLEAGK